MPGKRPFPFFASLCFFLSLAGAGWGLPEGFKKSILMNGLNPVSLVTAPDGRVFVVEKHGVIRVVDRDGKPVAQPLLNFEANTNDDAEKGMMAMLLHPDFPSNGLIFVQYTNSREFAGRGRNQISQFKVTGNTADPASEKLIFSTGDAGQNYHHGGGLSVGPDGKLYIASGNRNNGGASGGSSDKNSILGKILRVNLDGTIPSDNPFFNENTGDAKAVWAYGFRNPFSFSFKGDKLYVNDVADGKGDDELNDVVKGGFYGYNAGGGTGPLYRASGVPNYGTKAMVGALFYTGTQFPEKWRGAFFFGGEEETDRRMHVFHPAASGAARFEEFDRGAQAGADGSECAIGYAMDVVGSVYIATRCLTRRWTGGKVIRFSYGDPPPWPTTQALLNADLAGKALRWKPAAGGLAVELLRDQAGQAVELVDLRGRVVARAAAGKAGTVTLATDDARGVHFLKWSGDGRAAAVKVML